MHHWRNPRCKIKNCILLVMSKNIPSNWFLWKSILFRHPQVSGQTSKSANQSGSTWISTTILITDCVNCERLIPNISLAIQVACFLESYLIYHHMSPYTDQIPLTKMEQQMTQFTTVIFLLFNWSFSHEIQKKFQSNSLLTCRQHKEINQPTIILTPRN